MSIGAEIKKPETPKRRGWSNWILWWQIDPTELAEQVRLYDTLGIWNSMRGISVLCLGFSCVVTVLLVALSAGGADLSSFLDAAVMAVLAGFIYFGHRWAMIGAMILWTLEKGLMIFGNPAMGVVQLIWWSFFLHAFYFAFRVEQERRKPPVQVEVFE